MLRAGIFLDVESLVRGGGWGIRFRTVRRLVEAQGATVLRASAYMAVDRQRELQDPEYGTKKQEYRDAVRREGFHLTLQDVSRGGSESVEAIAGAGVALAVDAMQQCDNLDVVLLGAGEAAYTPLARALRARGRRVDLLSFSDTAPELLREVDQHFAGFLYPGILPEPKDDPDRQRGVMHHVIEDKGFGFLTVQTGLAAVDRRDDVFLHINDFFDDDGQTLGNDAFAAMKRNQTIIEFDLVEQDAGRYKAVDACEFVPDSW